MVSDLHGPGAGTRHPRARGLIVSKIAHASFRGISLVHNETNRAPQLQHVNKPRLSVSTGHVLTVAACLICPTSHITPHAAETPSSLLIGISQLPRDSTRLGISRHGHGPAHAIQGW